MIWTPPLKIVFQANVFCQNKFKKNHIEEIIIIIIGKYIIFYELNG